MYQNAFFSFLLSKAFHLQERLNIELNSDLGFLSFGKMLCKVTSINKQNQVPLSFNLLGWICLLRLKQNHPYLQIQRDRCQVLFIFSFFLLFHLLVSFRHFTLHLPFSQLLRLFKFNSNHLLFPHLFLDLYLFYHL